MNVVVLQGKLSRGPEERVLRSGSHLVTYEVTTRDGAGKARTVPVAWFDPGRRAPSLGEGDEVTVVGEVARRFFRTGAATASRTEVVASVVLASRRRSAVRGVLRDAVAELGPAIDPE
ncbi:MAG: single-stranded DNA-binding protein [Acidimicrobiales bacterium]